MNREEILQAAGIPANRWPDCYVTDKGAVFTPRIDKDGQKLATGEQAYQEWQAAKSAPAAPTVEERMSEIEAAVAEMAFGGEGV